MGIEVEKFKDFNVYHLEENYSLFHIDIENESTFYKKIVEFFLDSEKLIKYIENSKDLEIDYDTKTIETIFDFLYIFLDQENDEMDISKFEKEVQDIIKEEAEKIREEKTKTFVRLSKIGRFGEFIMSCILKEYFGFDCIIPKLKLTTDRNMSVYGIDTVYMNIDSKLLLFGESKISKNLKSAIGLINQSLKEYEKNIEEEYMLILKNNTLKKLKEFEEYYNEQRNNGICLNFKDFINTAKVSKLGIPIFMAHGEEKESEEILKGLAEKIKRENILDLETEYYLISLPILDKSKFVIAFTEKIKEIKDNYEAIIRGKNDTRM